MIALGPVAVYGLALGLVQFSRRPLLTTGTREIYAIGLAVCGLIVVGPLSLFMPEFLAERMGLSEWSSVAVWGLLLVAYSLVLTFVALMSRPRLVVYNVSVKELFEALSDLLTRIDGANQWTGNCMAFSELGVQFQVEHSSSPRSVSLVATTPYQQQQGWRQLENELAAELSKLEVEQRRGSGFFLYLSLSVLAAIAWRLMMDDPQEIVAALVEILRP